MARIGRKSLTIPLLVATSVAAAAQHADPAGANLVSSGQVTVDGRSVAYRIRHLPVSSFPELPAVVADELTRRGCLIPQTYEAHQPENVIHGGFERAGSEDWAALCSVDGTVRLLVFFSNALERPVTVASAAETARLQSYPGSDVLGFNWGIDAASPERVRQAQVGMSPRPARLEHDALADSVVDRSTIYRYFGHGAWMVVQMP